MEPRGKEKTSRWLKKILKNRGSCPQGGLGTTGGEKHAVNCEVGKKLHQKGEEKEEGDRGIVPKPTGKGGEKQVAKNGPHAWSKK